MRHAFLLEASPDDAGLRNEVSLLLAAHESTRDPFAVPAVEHLANFVNAELTGSVGGRIGPYELIRLVGVGGMGAVYEAVRADDQFRMRVAVKLLGPAMQGDDAIRRFRLERQILADLDHPNIAGLLDGNVTEARLPYLVMEYVEGEPITKWCDARRLGIRERIVLFLQVCRAVRHAHQHLVVHRDLKPANILVTADGAVKLLDFGIAKLLDDSRAVESPATVGGGVAGTPTYASPEQMRGQPVGTAADVYALGAILYELLAGRPPLDVQNRSLGEAERIITTVDPPRPSMTVDDEAAAARGIRSGQRLGGRLRGDLDAIALVALRKEPERRYGSVEALLLDLQRWLDRQPVTARGDGFAYRIGKLARRRRVELVFVAALVTSVAAGLIATFRQARAAEAERARTAAINEFLLTMLGAADPGSLGPDATVRSVLDSASATAANLSSQPELEAEVRLAIGSSYVGLGEYDAAREHFERALEVRRARAPNGDRATAMAMFSLGSTFEFEGDFATADSIYQAALRPFPGENGA